jgi:hypothetical protein
MHTQNKISSIPLRKSMDSSSITSGQFPPLKQFAKRELSREDAPYEDANPFKRNETLLAWKALSFIKTPKSNAWYIVVFIILVFLMALGLFTDNFPLAILAILIGLILYLFEKKDPQAFGFAITVEGVVAQNRLYKFSSLENFWIFYVPGGKKELSLKSTKAFIPYITIPLGNVDPVLLRKILVEFLPEVEHDDVAFDSLEKLF